MAIPRGFFGEKNRVSPQISPSQGDSLHLSQIVALKLKLRGSLRKVGITYFQNVRFNSGTTLEITKIFRVGSFKSQNSLRQIQFYQRFCKFSPSIYRTIKNYK
uniref:Uncharacterized protein n=1 Tax=Sphaerodactylus townsendi TaxID=933632 RepID=A0ACB8FS21_9SAUR